MGENSPSRPSAAGPDDAFDDSSEKGSDSQRSTIPRLHSVGPDAYPNWDAIYLDNVERVYRMMYARVGNRADAEDLTAEVFQAALKPLRASASVGEVRAYLLATARTVLASHWRRHYGAEITTIDLTVDRAALDEPPTESDAPRRVREVLAKLPERYARILQLRFLEACTLREAAHAMNISLGNAKVLQHRALRHAAQVTGESQ
ncbi:MAG TPA: sigma-70 family RNA polymerase sigma factor [Acidimicrobiia bacterium]|jgi:RNA polymerase sigma-70 factor (ECF subfamily)|nr:sigma-70 family RNA polymerase sigma factor [Acidimicrobiia bacterium]